MTNNTYSNGAPRVGWCLNCQRPVSLTSYGWLVPHHKGKKACHSDWVPMEEASIEEAKQS